MGTQRKPIRRKIDTGTARRAEKLAPVPQEKNTQVNPVIRLLKPATFWKTEEELAAEEAAGRD